jgi:hypothetical protein
MKSRLLSIAAKSVPSVTGALTGVPPEKLDPGDDESGTADHDIQRSEGQLPCGWGAAPLACGGPDTVSNIQWQTTADGKAKDKWERKDCR